MKNVSVVVLSILVVILSVYCYWQRGLGEEQKALAEKSAERAMIKQVEAEKFRKEAEMSKAEALVQKQLAEQLMEKLQTCQSKKK